MKASKLPYLLCIATALGTAIAVLTVSRAMFLPKAIIQPNEIMSRTTEDDPISKSSAPRSEVLRLATESDFAIVGTMVDFKVIGKRLSPEELVKIDDLSKTIGGEVYSIHIEDVVIKRADFGNGGPQPHLAGPNILVFKRQGAPYYPNAYYVPRQRYLIFLKEIQDQNELQKAYKLDAGKIYYQEFEPLNGVMAITDRTQPFLTKLGQLGEALKPTESKEKVRRLKKLTRSPDPSLRDAATQAIDLIKQNQHQDLKNE